MWHHIPSIKFGIVIRFPYGSTVFKGRCFFIGNRIAGYIERKLAAIFLIGVPETQSIPMRK